MIDINKLIEMLTSHSIIRAMILFIVADIFFGTLRAIKQHCFNSSVGINGAIRKVGMIASMVFLVAFDSALKIDATKLIPSEVIEFLGMTNCGLTELFGLLFVAYEIVSVLKNMTLSGLPVNSLWIKAYKFLSKWTDELPSTPIEEETEK